MRRTARAGLRVVRRVVRFRTTRSGGRWNADMEGRPERPKDSPLYTRT